MKQRAIGDRREGTGLISMCWLEILELNWQAWGIKEVKKPERDDVESAVPNFVSLEVKFIWAEDSCCFKRSKISCSHNNSTQ